MAVRSIRILQIEKETLVSLRCEGTSNCWGRHGCTWTRDFYLTRGLSRLVLWEDCFQTHKIHSWNVYHSLLSSYPSLKVGMNWTGGTLQRVKVGRQNRNVQKQKERFAKARTQIQNGPSSLTSPFRLENENRNSGRWLPSLGSGPVQHVGHSKRLHDRDDKINTQTSSNVLYRQGTDTHQANKPTLTRRRSSYRSASPTDSGKPPISFTDQH